MGAKGGVRMSGSSLHRHTLSETLRCLVQNDGFLGHPASADWLSFLPHSRMDLLRAGCSVRNPS